jgi:hypothetical protein
MRMPQKDLTASARAIISDATAASSEIIMPGFFNSIASVSNYLGLSAPPQADGDKAPAHTTPVQPADADEKGRSGAKGWIPRPHHMAVALLGAYAAMRTMQAFSASQDSSAVGPNTPAHPQARVTFDSAPDTLAFDYVPQPTHEATWTTVEVKPSTVPEVPPAQEEQKAQMRVEPYVVKVLTPQLEQAPDMTTVTAAGADGRSKSKLNFDFSWKHATQNKLRNGAFLLGSAASLFRFKRSRFNQGLEREDLLPPSPPPAGALYNRTSRMKEKCKDERIRSFANPLPVENATLEQRAFFRVEVNPADGSLYFPNMQSSDTEPEPIETEDAHSTWSAGPKTMLVYMEPTDGEIYVFPERQCVRHSSMAYATPEPIDPAFVGTVRIENGYLVGLTPWTADFESPSCTQMRNFLSELRSRGANLEKLDKIAFGRNQEENAEMIAGRVPLPEGADEVLDFLSADIVTEADAGRMHVGPLD